MPILAKFEDMLKAICANCGGTAPQRRCSRCGSASYCSKECQRAHWKKGHRDQCCDKDMDIQDFELQDYEKYIWYNT